MVELLADERIDRLVREGIDIIQSRSVFSFSLDAVLLAHFASLPVKKSALIIDACSGNGAVAFMLSAKTQQKIYAIEYQERLADMARRSIALNGLEDRIEVIHGDYKEALSWFKTDSVDVITCNPPYFALETLSKTNEKEPFLLARHESTITLDQWVQQSSRLLKVNGKLFCVHRPDRLMEILDTMRKHRLAPKKIQFVHPKAEREANMVLIEAVKDGREKGLKILTPITVFDESNQYTPLVRGILHGH